MIFLCLLKTVHCFFCRCGDNDVIAIVLVDGHDDVAHDDQDWFELTVTRINCLPFSVNFIALPFCLMPSLSVPRSRLRSFTTGISYVVFVVKCMQHYVSDLDCRKNLI